MEFAGSNEPTGFCRITFDQESIPVVREAFRHFIETASGDEDNPYPVNHFHRSVLEWKDTRSNYALTPYPERVADILSEYSDVAYAEIDQLMDAVQDAYASDEPADASVLRRVQARYATAHHAAELATALTSAAAER